MKKENHSPMPKIITIATGTELMLGDTLDRDFALMGRKLALSGYSILKHYVVGDHKDELKNTFSEAIKKADVVIMTGGLGPTTDDLTREVVSSVVKKPLKINRTIIKSLKNRFKRAGTKIPFCNYQQAMVLKDAKVIPNRIGTAPGMYIQKSSCHVFLLPGPPFEMTPMFEDYVIKKIKSLWPVRRRNIITFRTFGIRESEVQQMMNKILTKNRKLLQVLGYCSSPEGVDVRIITDQVNDKKISKDIEKIKKALNLWTYSSERKDLNEEVFRILKKRKKTISVAESCTGGLVSERLTSLAGASKIFKAGVVVYSNESKIKILKVEKNIIENYGAVSRETALAMAKNIRLLSQSDLGVSITGIAGPGGGNRKKPVGLVWIGFSDREKNYAEEHCFSGIREVIQFRASQAALMLVYNLLHGKVL